MTELIELFPGVYRVDRLLCTRSIAPGVRVYGERLVQANGVEYRQWDIYRSKLAGAIVKGLPELPIKPGSVVLYLGASTGTTPSHVSDLVGPEGGVFAVEFAQRSMRELLNVCEKRANILPIFGDARQPQGYREHMQGHKADVLYQDVAQPGQADILIKNAEAHLKEGGYAMLCIKSQSVDVTQSPRKTYEQEVGKLEAAGFTTLWHAELDPYDKDHLFWMGRKKE